MRYHTVHIGLGFTHPKQGFYKTAQLVGRSPRVFTHPWGARGFLFPSTRGLMKSKTVFFIYPEGFTSSKEGFFPIRGNIGKAAGLARGFYPSKSRFSPIRQMAWNKPSGFYPSMGSACGSFPFTRDLITSKTRIFVSGGCPSSNAGLFPICGNIVKVVGRGTCNTPPPTPRHPHKAFAGWPNFPK